ncbi:Uncharacterized protein Fot_14543 [Forsythia ovata]|uniref:Uncharacterized protein n=1 Tax=Forsythia ovata TaxID=205694 RepID=A0ABD1W6M3_9LAMI
MLPFLESKVIWTRNSGLFDSWSLWVLEDFFPHKKLSKSKNPCTGDDAGAWEFKSGLAADSQVEVVIKKREVDIGISSALLTGVEETRTEASQPPMKQSWKCGGREVICLFVVVSCIIWLNIGHVFW